MRERLAALGFPGVQAQTFHAAASGSCATSGAAVGQPAPSVLGSKAPLLAPLQRSLPGGYKFTAIKDLADELEWAKARRLDPSTYQETVEAMGRTPPIPGDLFTGCSGVTSGPRSGPGGSTSRTCWSGCWRGSRPARTWPRSSAASTAGSRWTSTRTPTRSSRRCWRRAGGAALATVGDEDQTIYTFTGATSEYLDRLVRRSRGQGSGWRTTTGPALRSCPGQPAAGRHPGSGRTGQAAGRHQARGRSRPWSAFENAEREARAWSPRSPLAGAGVDADEVAVLVRTNAQIPPLEEALAAAGIRHQVRGELFFRRTEVLRAIGVLRRARPGRPAGPGRRPGGDLVQLAGFRRGRGARRREARQRHASLVTLLGIAERVGDEGRHRRVP